ncbi:MAG: hypothetical protein NXI00_12265 [Cytophagales bacterium]|nr:hypothetical protein [Cytophagales bacterium]
MQELIKLLKERARHESEKASVSDKDHGTDFWRHKGKEEAYLEIINELEKMEG